MLQPSRLLYHLDGAVLIEENLVEAAGAQAAVARKYTVVVEEVPLALEFHH